MVTEISSLNNYLKNRKSLYYPTSIKNIHRNRWAYIYNHYNTNHYYSLSVHYPTQYLTYFIQHQHQFFVGSTADYGLLHLRASTTEGITCIEDLQNNICRIHYLWNTSEHIYITNTNNILAGCEFHIHYWN